MFAMETRAMPCLRVERDPLELELELKWDIPASILRDPASIIVHTSYNSIDLFHLEVQTEAL